MKKLLLLAVSILLLSCTGEPLPSHISMNDGKTHKFMFYWESNQIEPYASYKIYRQGVVVESGDNIKEHTFDLVLNNGDFITIGVNNNGSNPRPLCYLAISRYDDINLSKGYYTPDQVELLYELEANTNGIGYNGYINKEGKVQK